MEGNVTGVANKQIYRNSFLIISCIVGFFFVFVNTNIESGFFLKLIIGIGASITAMIGFFIGDVLRKFVVPDAVFTSGGFFKLLKIKLFWMCGPQLIGIGIGAIIGVSMLGSLFGVLV